MAASDTGHSPPLLEIESVSVSYGKVEAVHQVSIRLARGSIVTVVGPNEIGRAHV